MDSTAQIKKNLISRIKNSEDLNFLKALQTIIDASEKSVYQLSPEQEEAIEQARKEIKAGKSKENGLLISEMKEWLEKK